MSKYTLFTGRNGQFYFNLKASNGEIIGASEGYTTKQSAQEGIKSCQANGSVIDRYELFEGSNGQFYWRLKARNGQIILQSEGYVSKQGAGNGVSSCTVNSSTTTIHDLT